ncbi:MAG: hypothetical protein Q8922_07920 [Bacteroidota bacterium]|nr:hypothetical protein [Bacteroidota bacterium]MDP4234151.1 hypothetical protein [Bacteroidota bacterium]MDP4244027.1 hypothetical protein [Bacteroidota bacterium]MDP4287851.1 hypothetical protein [Bacteroidota bacterium]
MMKRVLSLSAVALVVWSVMVVVPSGKAIAQNKVLIEEFTSSTCPPCAATDPMVRQVVSDLHDSVVIIRWHQNYPEPGDPSNLMFPAGRSRGDYYGVQGIPAASVNGGINFNPGIGVAAFEDNVNTALSEMQNYFTMSVSQSTTPDSVIVLVTVKTGPTVPTDPAMRLAVVVCERFAVYAGSNGLPMHDYMARAAIPALATNGSIPVSAAFNQAANTTQTYRYAAQIKSTWNPAMLEAVAFIQSEQAAGAIVKPVYQAAWTENVNLDISPNATTGILMGDGNTLDYTVTNNSSTQQKVFLSIAPSASVAPNVLTLKGDNLNADGSITLAPMTSAQVSVVAPTSGPYTGWGFFGLMARTADSIGIGGTYGLAVGKDVKTLILDNGAGFEGMGAAQLSPPNTLKSLNNIGIPAALIRYENMTAAFSDDWSNFNNVIIDGGPYYTGVFTNDGSMDRITQHLAGGGNLILEDAPFAAVYSRPSVGMIDFVEGTFHCDSVKNNSTTWTSINGVAGDPIGDGLSSVSVSSVTGTQSLKSFDAGGHAIFTTNRGDTVGIRSESGPGKAVYTTFELGNISSGGGKRDTVFKRIFNWFNSAPSAVATAPDVPSNFVAAPNPFHGITQIAYTPSKDEHDVSFSAYDLLGREVAKLSAKPTGASYEATFDANSLSAGSYVIVVHSSTGSRELKVLNQE